MNACNYIDIWSDASGWGSIIDSIHSLAEPAGQDTTCQVLCSTWGFGEAQAWGWGLSLWSHSCLRFLINSENLRFLSLSSQSPRKYEHLLLWLFAPWFWGIFHVALFHVSSIFLFTPAYPSIGAICHGQLEFSPVKHQWNFWISLLSSVNTTVVINKDGNCHTEAASVDPLYVLHLETTETVTHKQPLLCPAQK